MKMNCGVIVALALVTVLSSQTLDYIYVSARLGKTLIYTSLILVRLAKTFTQNIS